MYDSGDTLDTPSQPRPKPAAVALRIPSHTYANLPNSRSKEESNNQENELEEDQVVISYTGISSPRLPPATSATTVLGDAPIEESSSQTLAAGPGTSFSSTYPGSRRLDRSDTDDVDLYASADGDSPTSSRRSQAVEVGFDTYAFVDKANSQTASASQGEVYAVVNKSKPQTTLCSIMSGVGIAEKSGVDECNTYAVVDKSSSRRNAGVASTLPVPSAATDNAGQAVSSHDVYAQVDKRAQRKNSAPSGHAMARPEIKTHAEVLKPKKTKPGVKPKPKLPNKPSSHHVTDRKRTGFFFYLGMRAHASLSLSLSLPSVCVCFLSLSLSLSRS